MQVNININLDSLSYFWLVIEPNYNIQSCSPYFYTLNCQGQSIETFFDFIQPLVNLQSDLPNQELVDKIIQLKFKLNSIKFRFTAHKIDEKTLLLGWPSLTNLEEIKKFQLMGPMRHPACQIADVLILKDVLKNQQQTIRNLEIEKYQKDLEEQERITQHQSKLASIGELTAGIAHEINNPLSVTMGLTELLRKLIQKENFALPKAIEYLDKQKTAHSRIRNIVQGLRTYARIDTVEEEIFSLPEVIEDTLNLTEELFKKDHVEIKYQRQQPELLIKGVPGEIQQVLVNLLSNSKHAMEGRDSKNIEILLETPTPNLVVVKVTDNGAGIPSHILERIFQPFFTTKSAGTGTGLGLAITYKIIKKIGGEIKVGSEMDKGTSFLITLPLQKVNNIDGGKNGS